MGVKFQSSLAGYITGIRFYKGTGNTGTHIGNLWTTSGTLLESVTFSGETASGWQQATFATPVAITAGTTYVASYFAPMGHYCVRQQLLHQLGDQRPADRAGQQHAWRRRSLHVRREAARSPAIRTQSSNYWVDVMFSPQPEHGQLNWS